MRVHLWGKNALRIRKASNLNLRAPLEHGSLLLSINSNEPLGAPMFPLNDLTCMTRYRGMELWRHAADVAIWRYRGMEV